jgi:hypothetical protein
MSPRQARRERREAERKARKAEMKRAKARELGFVSQKLPASDEPLGFVSQNAATPVTGAPFVSQSRAEINRGNAQHSTGPRSAEGKLASSRNSLKHGLAGGTLFIPGEDAAAFEALRNALIDEHQPATETEVLLVQEMAQSWWLTQRAIRLQNECFTPEGVDQRQLSLLLRYQTTHDRAFYKALNTLIRLKQSRAREQAVGKPGFVSQNRAAGHSSIRFVPQTTPESNIDAGFVSQTGLKTPQNWLAQTLAA